MEDFELELDEMELVAAAAGYHYYNSLTKQPRRSHNESPCGTRFMAEVLNGDDDGCREMFRMDKHVFHKLCRTLQTERHATGHSWSYDRGAAWHFLEHCGTQ